MSKMTRDDALKMARAFRKFDLACYELAELADSYYDEDEPEEFVEATFRLGVQMQFMTTDEIEKAVDLICTRYGVNIANF